MPRVLAAAAAAALALLAVAAAQATCRDPVSSCSPSNDYFPDKIQIDHASATLPSVKYANTHVDVTVNPGPDSPSYRYRLVRCGCEAVAPKPPDGVVSIPVPPNGLYVGDTIIMAMLTTEVDARDFVKAVSDVTYAYSPQVRRAVADGTYAQTTSPKDLIGNSQVSLSIINSFSSSIDAYANATRDGLTVPFFVSAEKDEVDPLGRAEWIKVFGLLLARPVSTTNTFKSIEFRYNSVKSQAFSVRRRPSVMLNQPYQGTWTQPGGNQYTTAFLRDANVDYRFANDGKSTGNFLSLSDVEGNFSSARYWVNMARFPASTDDSLNKMLNDVAAVGKDAVATMKKLASVKCGKAWAQSKRITDDGNANDFFEQGALRPDLILTDLLAIFHPAVSSVTPEEMTFYYSMGSPGKGQTDACPFNELPLDAPSGKVFRTTEVELVGVDRFTVEDQLAAGGIAKEVASAVDVKESELEMFFDRPVEDKSNNTYMKVRSMISESKDADFDDNAVASALKDSVDGATSAKVISSQSTDSSRSSGDDDGLSGGAIAGIVIGSLLALALVAVAAFFVASRRSRRAAYSELKDRFWQEHGVRLAEDADEQGGQRRDPVDIGDDGIRPAL